MTKHANRLGMYADVRQILDAALSAGGGSYQCDSHGQAVHWRQRAYKFRKLYAETIGLNEESPYDQIVMPRVAEAETTVSIHIRRQVGVFMPAAEPAPANILLGDDLFDIAKGIADKLGE